MSLHPDVQNLAAQGRNGDSMLLHVTPDEVQGLHQLALMHGTKMTINPVTGLPEANFMKDWLPVIVGGLATIATGGLAAPYMIGAGALGAFGTSMAVGNSFKKSLFTGLMAGAGGALGAGLGAAGAGVGAAAGEGIAAGSAGLGVRALAGAEAQAIKAAASGGSRVIAPGAFEAAGVGGAESLGANVIGSTAARGMGQAELGALRAETQQVAQNATKQAAAKAVRPGVTRYTGTTGQVQTAEQSMAQEAAMNQNYGATRLPQVRPTSSAAQPINQPPANITSDTQRFLAQAEQPQMFSQQTMPGYTPFAAPQSYMGGVSDALSAQGRGVNKLFEPGEFSKFAGNNKLALAGLGAGAIGSMSSDQQKLKPATAHGDYYSYPGFTQGYDPTGGASGQQYFNYGYGTPTVTHYAEGGSIGDEVNNVMYPQSQLPTGTVGQYGNRSAVPVPREVVGAQDAVVNPFTGAEGMAAGGIATLGGYSDGGRLTQGPGDGVSDSIPASIGGKQPARLADGEFVIPARIVSEIGNGSTKAGAKKLYAMMDRIQKARRKTTNIAANTRAERFMPA